jgi:hypothetical protein
LVTQHVPDVSPRYRLERPATRRAASACAPVRPGDLERLADFDAAAFGDRRQRLLDMLAASALGAFRVPDTGPLRGYLIVQRSAHGARLGPWVAEDVEAAERLLAAGLSSVSDRPVVVATPGRNHRCRELLRARGFEVVPSSLRMVRGEAVGRGQPERVYGLASGAVG